MERLTAKQRTMAVYDLLKYWRDPGHAVKHGQLLAPVLGVDGVDEARIALALKQRIERELTQQRQRMNIDTPSATVPADVVLSHDRATNNERLELLSLVWAHYLNGLSVADLMQMYDRSERTVEVNLQRGRTVVADLVASDEALAYDGHHHAPTTYTVPGGGAAFHRRRVLLDKVRRAWITGVLEASTNDGKLLDIPFVVRPDIVRRSWHDVIDPPAQHAQSCRAITTIIEAFDAAGGELLILGAGGSGKTITLLQLARELACRAEQDARHPVPVIFHLASWRETFPLLEDWIVSELSKRYTIPTTVAAGWLKHGMLLPLLDGLDEVAPLARTHCILAINHLHSGAGVTGLVVASRTDVYAMLKEQLQLETAVELQPLREAQVDNYLQQAGADSECIRAALAADESLWDLVTSPLMLHIMVEGLKHLPCDNLSKDVSHRDRRSYLLDTYGARMLSRRRSMRPAPHQATQWLGWLALSLEEHNEALFLIEGIQPLWLPVPQRMLYLRCVGALRGLLVGVSCGALVLLTLLLVPLMGFPPFGQTPIHPRVVLAATLGGATGFGLLLSVVGYMVAQPSARESILCVDVLHWSQPAARTALLLGGIVGTLCAIVFSCVLGTGLGLLAGMGIGVGLSALVIGRDLQSSEMAIEQRMVPNQGIRRSARHAIIMGGVGLLGGIPLGILAALFAGSITGVIFSLMFGGALALLFSLFYGGETVLKHALLRYLLYRLGHAPLNYPAFLDAMVDRGLLVRVGGAYTFIHTLLRQSFAQRYKAGSVSAEQG